MTPDEQHALADRLDEYAVDIDNIDSSGGFTAGDASDLRAAAVVLRATASDTDEPLPKFPGLHDRPDTGAECHYLAVTMPHGGLFCNKCGWATASNNPTNTDAYPDLVLQLRSLSDRSCKAAADIIEQLAAERDAAVAEVQQLRNAIGDLDELRAMAKYGTAENGHGDDLNEVAHRIADAADEVAAVSPATPTPTTCPTCGSDDPAWTGLVITAALGAERSCADPWHTDNTP